MLPGPSGSPKPNSVFDAVVLGAGPAGAAFALNLAPRHRVLLLDRQAGPRPRIGESLAPATRRLLDDMGLWSAFLELKPAPTPCHAHRSAWGSDEIVEADSLRNLDGPGWQIDRASFEAWLLKTARAHGTVVLQGASVGELRPIPAQRSPSNETSWQLSVHHSRSSLTLQTRLLIDATGRNSTLPASLGARRTPRDRLVCAWLRGRDQSETERNAGVLWIVAEPEGWWYCTPLPNGNRVVAFHTDADLPALRSLSTSRALLARALQQPHLGSLLEQTGFTPIGADPSCGRPGESPRIVRAHTSRLSPASGPGWLAVGDAAQSFDPLASQGLFHALYTGLAGAEAADRHLSGDREALPDYARSLDPIHESCQRELAAWYAREPRWPNHEFWRRRHVPPTPSNRLPTS